MWVVVHTQVSMDLRFWLTKHFCKLMGTPTARIFKSYTKEKKLR